MELPNARPYAFRFRPKATALVVIDMQRDFLEPGGFGSTHCGNAEVFNRVRKIVPTTQRVLQACRKLGFYVMHTREGHRPDLSDLPASKRSRQVNTAHGHHTIGIGEPGPMGRLLVRGEYGHDIIDGLKPWPGEVIIDKPGKESFWDTGLYRALLARGITHLLLAGVTTEFCVNITAREAADRGFECCILSDCTSGFDSTVFGVPEDFAGEFERHRSDSGFSRNALQRIIERLIAAGGRRLDVDCGFFEHINDQEDTATWHDFEYRKLKMARDTSKMFEKIDVLVTLSPTYGSMGVNSSMLDLCSISLKSSIYGEEAEEDSGFAVLLIGMTGKDRRLFDISCETEDQSITSTQI